MPVTSDVMGGLEQSLPATRADLGMIVTTSFFTEGARERARGLPVELFDREPILKWIEQEGLSP